MLVGWFSENVTSFLFIIIITFFKFIFFPLSFNVKNKYQFNYCSLQATIGFHRPDIIPHRGNEHDIPENPPHDFFDGTYLFYFCFLFIFLTLGECC